MDFPCNGCGEIWDWDDVRRKAPEAAGPEHGQLVRCPYCPASGDSRHLGPSTIGIVAHTQGKTPDTFGVFFVTLASD